MAPVTLRMNQPARAPAWSLLLASDQVGAESWLGAQLAAHRPQTRVSYLTVLLESCQHKTE